MDYAAVRGAGSFSFAEGRGAAEPTGEPGTRREPQTRTRSDNEATCWSGRRDSNPGE